MITYMDANRMYRWMEDLEERVKREGGENPRQNIFWLIEHLTEYLQRWLGFASMEQLEVEWTFENDVFCLVMAAVEVVNKKVGKGSQDWFPQAVWKKFEIALEFIQEHPSKENLDFVSQGFDDVMVALR